MELSARIVQSRNFAKFTQEELANKLNISRRNLQDLEKGNSDPKVSVLLKISETCGVNPCWLLSEKGQMFSTQIDIPDLTQSYFLEAIKASEFNFQEIESILAKYILSKHLQPLQEIRNSQGLWDRLFFNRFQNIGYMRILTRALIEAKETYKTETFTAENSKRILKQIVNDYELRLTKDKINNLISEKTRRELLVWIDSELSNLACLVMLSDLDIAISAIKETLDKIDQITIKLD